MHFENMKGIHISIPGTEKQWNPDSPPGIPDKITHYEMIHWLENSSLDADTTKELIREVSKYPANTMRHFYLHINDHIARIHSGRDKNPEE